MATRIGSAWGTPYGVISALLVAVVAGLLATGPLMALAGDAYAGLRHANWREAEGRYTRGGGGGSTSSRTATGSAGSASPTCGRSSHRKRPAG